MLPNPQSIVFVCFCCFLNSFGDSLSDGNGVITKPVSNSNNGVIDAQDSRKQLVKNGNQTDYVKENIQLIRQPLKLTLQTRTTQNQFTKKVPKNQTNKINRTEMKESSSTNPSQKFGFDIGGSNSRRKNSKKNQQSFIQRILPMLVTPFLISSAMVPMMMISLLHMLVKSAFIGKIGLILMLINMFSNRRNPGGVSHHDLDSGYSGNHVAMQHYGWHGDEEYGAYVNRKRRR